jgi:hypothetical protein
MQPGLTPARRRTVLLGALATPVLPRTGHAETWPSRPVRLVIPFGAGGSVDVVGRLLAEKFGALLGQPLIIDNRPGGGTAIGAVHVARSAPDGYTLFYGTPATQIINPTLVPNLPYDPDRDLLPTGSVMRAERTAKGQAAIGRARARELNPDTVLERHHAIARHNTHTAIARDRHVCGSIGPCGDQHGRRQKKFFHNRSTV